MFSRTLSRFHDDVLDLPSGIVMITGPTGTGKTTTLYSCVNYLNSIDRCITTVEDPVEYVIEGIAQCSLNPKIDVTFETTLPYVCLLYTSVSLLTPRRPPRHDSRLEGRTRARRRAP